MVGRPLSNVNRGATFTAGAEAFKEHPELMRTAMQTIAAGAGMDYVLAFLLSHLLHADPKTGMAMYSRIIGGEGRRAALKGAAKARLSAPDYLLFDVLFNWTGVARGIRNDFCHHLWGYSPQVPEAVLLIDPQCMIDFDVGVRQANMHMAITRAVVAPERYDLSLIQVIMKPDMDDALDAVTRASGRLVQLGLDFQETAGRYISLDTRTELLMEPLIQEVYQRRRQSELPPEPEPQPDTPAAQ